MTSRSIPRALRWLRPLLFVVIAGAGAQLGAKLLTSGDETSDDFRLAAIIGGREFKSSATELRTASALAVVGGIELDLREARLDPAGASLDLRTAVGGIEVRVPREWAVEIDARAIVGGVDQRLGDSSQHAENTPRLRVKARALLGGIEIRNDL